jgi:hypothetical protein
MSNITSNRIYELAAQALELSHNDPVCAVEILREWTGLSFEMAFEAIDHVMELPDFDDREYFAAEPPYEEP